MSSLRPGVTKTPRDLTVCRRGRSSSASPRPIATLTRRRGVSRRQSPESMTVKRQGLMHWRSRRPQNDQGGGVGRWNDEVRRDVASHRAHCLMHGRVIALFGPRACSFASSISSKPIAGRNTLLQPPLSATSSPIAGVWPNSPLDRDLLQHRQIRADPPARGTMPDGTPFSIPDDTDHPPPLELTQVRERGATVYLALAPAPAGCGRNRRRTGGRMPARAWSGEPPMRRRMPMPAASPMRSLEMSPGSRLTYLSVRPAHSRPMRWWQLPSSSKCGPISP